MLFCVIFSSWRMSKKEEKKRSMNGWIVTFSAVGNFHRKGLILTQPHFDIRDATNVSQEKKKKN